MSHWSATWLREETKLPHHWRGFHGLRTTSCWKVLEILIHRSLRTRLVHWQSKASVSEMEGNTPVYWRCCYETSENSMCLITLWYTVSTMLYIVNILSSALNGSGIEILVTKKKKKKKTDVTHLFRLQFGLISTCMCTSYVRSTCTCFQTEKYWRFFRAKKSCGELTF